MRPKTFPRALIATLLATVGPFLLPALAEQDGGHPGAASATPPGGREVVTASGLHYVDLRIGQGDEAASGKIVEVRYLGWLEDGTRFDSSRDHDRPFTFRLGAGDALKGWDEGLVGMRVGGRRKLVIPPELGFGRQGVGSVVPSNAVLYYEFELLAVR
jgi:FKBP-type peptidyl-prolyl cis-trans isomerase